MELNKLLKLDKLFKNKMVLFITFFVSLVILFKYLLNQNYSAILFFIVIVFLTKHLSNNMIIILGTSIITTYLLHLFKVFTINNVENLDNINDNESINNIFNRLLVANSCKNNNNINDVHNNLKNIEQLLPNYSKATACSKYQLENSQGKIIDHLDKISFKQINDYNEKINKQKFLLNSDPKYDSIKYSIFNLNNQFKDFINNKEKTYDNNNQNQATTAINNMQ